MDIAQSTAMESLLPRKIGNLNEVSIKELRSDNGTKFRNHNLEELCDEKGEAVNTACYTKNKSIIVKRHGKTAYDVIRGRSSDISYFYMFGYPVHIHNHKDHLGKFDEKADDGFFLSYSLVAKSFKAILSTFPTYLHMKTPHPLIHPFFKTVSFEEPHEFTIVDDHPASNELDQPKSYENLESVEIQDNIINEPISDVQPTPILSPSAEGIFQPHVPQDRRSREKHIELVNIIGEPLIGITTRSRVRDSEAASVQECLYVNFLSEMEPTKLIEALEEEGWIIAMQEELSQFERNKV
uniref:Retrovirus-related Pol polyprotein from transposon TNT 1-94 n=1 Tax=Tanacetum cinerariifolium TaxID=118510 RepID=A0A699GUT8_TANCI|nr:hypothetical protein [Tanacetum cinerariifolium]